MRKNRTYIYTSHQTQPTHQAYSSASSLDTSSASIIYAPTDGTYNKRHRISSIASLNVATAYLNSSPSLNEPTNGLSHSYHKDKLTHQKYQNHHTQKYFSTYPITRKTHLEALSNTSGTPSSQTPHQPPSQNIKNQQGFTPDIAPLTIAYSRPPNLRNQLSVCTIQGRRMPVSSYITDK
ncbi:hypothetical protein ACHAW6_005224 [Cyclotella cf. meneghiniana]